MEAINNPGRIRSRRKTLTGQPVDNRPVTIADLQAMEERIIKRLRVELMALHLGDDHIIPEEEAATLLGCSVSLLARIRRDEKIVAGFLGRTPSYSLGQIRRFNREIVSGRQVR